MTNTVLFWYFCIREVRQLDSQCTSWTLSSVAGLCRCSLWVFICVQIPIFAKHVSTQPRIINLFCARRCCCTLCICLRRTQTTAGSLMIMPPCLAACLAIGHFIDLHSSLISCIHTSPLPSFTPDHWLHINHIQPDITSILHTQGNTNINTFAWTSFSFFALVNNSEDVMAESKLTKCFVDDWTWVLNRPRPLLVPQSGAACQPV